MRRAVQRYNLFSGGSALPARWELGNWYRCHAHCDDEEALALANGLRDANTPCDGSVAGAGLATSGSRALPC